MVFLAIFTYCDVKNRRLQLWLIAVFAAIMIGLFVFGEKHDGFSLLIRLIPGLGLLTTAFVTKEAVGYGDGLVVLFCGLVLDIQVTISLVFVALILSAVASLVILVIKKGNRSTRLPFMPFLLAAWVMLLLNMDGLG